MSDEEEPTKVSGNAKGPILKPDGSVPAAGEDWTDGDDDPVSDEKEEDGARTPPPPPPGASWQGAFPAEYRTQDNLPQTPEAFALQKQLDRRGRKRRYPKPGQPGGSACRAYKCNGYDPDTKTWCDNRATDKVLGFAMLIRCSKHGNGRRHHGNCPARMLLPGKHKSGQKHNKIAKFSTTTVAVRCCNNKCAKAVAEVIHKHDKEGVPYPQGFKRPRSIPLPEVPVLRP